MREKIGITSLIGLPLLLSILGVKLELPLLSLLSIPSIVVLLILNYDKKYYPFSLFSISLSLLYSTTLISPYLIGTDIHTEYYYYKLAVDGWNTSLSHSYNSAIGLTVVGPFLTNTFGVDGYFIFKYIYPVVFSLTPIILYYTYREFLSEKKAFLSSFVVVAFPSFFLEVSGITKMQLSTPFFALLFYFLIKKNLDWRIRVPACIVSGILVSLFHYSLGYVVFLYLGAMVVGLLILRTPWLKFRNRFSIRGTLIVSIFIIVPTLFYFGWVSQGSPLDTLTFYAREHIFNMDPATSQFAIQIDTIRERWEEDQLQQYEKETGVRLSSYKELESKLETARSPLTAEEREAAEVSNSEGATIERLLREPEWTQVGLRELGILPGSIPSPNAKNFLIRAALGLDILDTPWLGRVFRMLQLCTQALIAIGFVFVVRRRNEFPVTWFILVGTSLVILLLILVKPGFSSLLNPTRLYLYTLILLAPLVVIGWSSIYRLLFKRKRYMLTSLILGLLVPYFLFTSGFVFEITKRPNIETLELPFSMGLSNHRIDIYGAFTKNDKEVSNWLEANLPQDIFVFADLPGMELLYDWTHFRAFHFPQNWLPQDISLIPASSWIFFREWNEENKMVTHWINTGLRASMSYENRGIPRLLEGRKIIYQVGDAVVYGVKE